MPHSCFPTPHYLMQKYFPDHIEAELVLKVYELRREPVMRESRDKINGSQFMPKSYEDVQAIRKPDHPLNAPFRQTSTYWELVYGLARHGIVHGDFLIESNGEGLILLDHIFPHLEQQREDLSVPGAVPEAHRPALICQRGVDCHAMRAGQGGLRGAPGADREAARREIARRGEGLSAPAP